MERTVERTQLQLWLREQVLLQLQLQSHSQGAHRPLPHPPSTDAPQLCRPGQRRSPLPLPPQAQSPSPPGPAGFVFSDSEDLSKCNTSYAKRDAKRRSCDRATESGRATHRPTEIDLDGDDDNNKQARALEKFSEEPRNETTAGDANDSPAPAVRTGMPFSQAFSAILRDLGAKRHYDDPETADPCDHPPVVVSLPQSCFPTPLSPEVELRHVGGSIVDPRSVRRVNHKDRSVPAETVPNDNDNHRPDEMSRVQIPEAAIRRIAKRKEQLPPNGGDDDEGTTEEVVGMGFFSSLRSEPAIRRVAKRKEQLPPNGVDDDEGTTEEVVRMGFFSSLRKRGHLHDDQVLGMTGKKKKQRRRRKPKQDLLEGVSMGFFSGQMDAAAGNSPSSSSTDSGSRELSDRISPLYEWAPSMDEQTRAIAEFSLPLVLPAVAFTANYSSFAWAYCFGLPVLHTLETALTNFGPKCDLHFQYAPIDPLGHMCIDLLLLHPMCVLAFLCPEAFGPYAYMHGTILFILEYIYWAVAYKDVVVQRKVSRRCTEMDISQ